MEGFVDTILVGFVDTILVGFVDTILIKKKLIEKSGFPLPLLLTVDSQREYIRIIHGSMGRTL